MSRYDIAKGGDIPNMLGGFGDSSDDEFPEVDVVIRQYRQKVQARREERCCDDDKGNTPTEKNSISRTDRNDPAKSNPAVKATPLRRRKLGQSQAIDGSLLKPWDDTIASTERSIRAPKSTGHAHVYER